MNPIVAIAILFGYILLLILVATWKGEDSKNDTFFIGKRESPWYLVAFGMIGASLSGVTFLSVPGAVQNGSFSYMQMVLGYLPGYMFIAFVLIPVYYKLNLTTIYGYLEERFGVASYKTGSAFFLLSRIVGASFRIYLVVLVLQIFICDSLGIPFEVTVAATIIIIWIYTFKSGIKSIVWTDSLQTLAMLSAVVITILMIGRAMELDISGLTRMVSDSDISQTFFFENGWADGKNFWKQFLAGASIAIVMTGLDQDMMQKNLSCRNIADAQKNVVTFSIVLVFANLLFLALGAILYLYAGQTGIALPDGADQVFPIIARDHLPPLAGAIFFVGVIAAAFSSADSALTSLTTVVCVDFLNFEKSKQDELKLQRTRMLVHILLSLLLLVVILVFKAINDDSVINQLFRFAGYTYGPLLGLYMLGLFTKFKPWDIAVPFVCVAAPFISHGLKLLIEQNTTYQMSFEFLILNGMVTFIGLLLTSYIPVSRATQS